MALTERQRQLIAQNAPDSDAYRKANANKENDSRRRVPVNTGLVQATPSGAVGITSPVKGEEGSIETSTAALGKSDIEQRMKQAGATMQTANQRITGYSRAGNMGKALEEEREKLKMAQAEYNSLKQQLALLEQNEALAKRAQEFAKGNEAYNALIQQDDFKAHSSAGATKDNSGSIPGNIVHYYRENEHPLYSAMTEQEVSIYDYLLGKGDAAGAQKYLEFLNEDLRRREGEAKAQEIQDIENPVERTLATGAHAFKAGVDNAMQGTVQFFRDEEMPTSATQFASAALMEDMGTWGRYAYSAVNTVGNMLPSIVVGTLTGGAGGAAAMGLSSSGNAYKQALTEGYDKSDARAYSVLVGASEAALQYAIGGISKLGGVADDVLLAKAAKLDKAYKRMLATGAIKLGSEITEEEVQLFLEPAIKSIIMDVPYDAPNFEEMVETAIVTALSTGTLEGGNILAAGVNRPVQSVQTENAASGVETASKYDAAQAAEIQHEGKTFRNLVVGFDTKVSEFFDRWRSGRKSHQGEKLEKLYMGKMPLGVKAKVADLLGYEVDERDFIVTNDDVKHIFDHHGDPEHEIEAGNIPLEPWMFDALPDVLANPDSITPGHVGESRKNSGKRGVLFSKAFPGGTVITVQYDNPGRKTMGTVTIYAKNKGATSELYAPVETDTSAVRPERSEPAPIVNTTIPHPANSVNSGAVQGFGENGTRVITEIAENSGMTMQKAQEKVRLAYQTGRSNLPGTQLDLTDIDQRRAYNAGKMDFLSEVTKQENVPQAMTDSQPGSVSEVQTGTDTAKPSVAQRGTEGIYEPISDTQMSMIENTFRAAKNMFGEQGTAAFSKQFDPTADQAKHLEAFARAYNDGLRGKRNNGYGTPTAEQYKAAFDAGKADARASLKADKSNVKFATSAEDKGLVYDEYVDALDAETAENINWIAKALGLRVGFVDEVNGGLANADINDFDVQIEKGNPNPELFLLGHEAAHRLRQIAPEQYRVFRNVALNDTAFVDDKVVIQQKLHADANGILSNEEAMDELAADYAGRLINDPEFLNRFIDRHRADRTFLEKVRDVFRDIALAVKDSMMGDKTARAELALTRVLEAGAKQSKTLQASQHSATIAATKHSLKDVRANFQRKFTGEVLEDEYIELSNGEKAAISHALKTGYGQIEPGGKRGRVSTTKYCYLFDVKGDGGVIVTDVVDNNELNIHNDNIDEEYENGHEHDQGTGQEFEGGRSGQRNGSDDISEGTQTRTNGANDRMVGAEQDSNTGGDLRQIRRDRENQVNAKNSLKGTELLSKGNQRDGESAKQIRAAAKEAYRELVKRCENMTPAQIARLTEQDADTTPELNRPEPSGINADTGKESKLYSSAEKSENVADETWGLIQSVDDIKYYQGISNMDTLNQASERLATNGQAETLRFATLDPKEAMAVDVAEGFILLKRYQDKGDYESAVTVLRKLREIGTTSGQAVQSFSLLGRLTPEGMAVYAQKELDQARKEMVRKKSEEWVDKRRAQFELTPEEVQFIKDTMERAAELPEGRDKNILIARIATMIEDKIPTTILKQIKGFTRNAMLLNTKTMMRNVVGNAIMMPAYAVQDFIAAGVDASIAKRTGVRTTGTTLPNRAALRAAKRGVYESFDDFRREVNTRQTSGDRFEVGGGPAFKRYSDGEMQEAGRARRLAMELSNALNKVDRVTGWLLDMGDRPFFEYHFTNSLNNQLRLNQTTQPTAEMIDIATTEALRRTWQDDNAYTKAVTTLRNTLNGGKDWGMGSAITTFVKTPANLTKALLEYSPLGLVGVLKNRAGIYTRSKKSKNYDPRTQKAFVDALAKSITGTLVMALGGLLAHVDLISGGDDEEDKDVAAFKQNVMGIAPYSVKIGGKSYTYDWAQPVGGLFAISADFVTNIKNGNEPAVTGLDILGDAGKAIMNALAAGGNVLFEQSFLQGVADLFADDGLVSGLISALSGASGQFMPTALSQIAQLADPYARTSFAYRDIPRTTVNKVIAKTPGLRSTLPAVVDVLGHDVLSYGGSNSVWNVFFNPANVYSETATKAAKEIYRVYEETGDTTIIPRKAPYYLEYKGERYNFTGEERADYQRAMGGTNEQVVSQLLSSQAYQSLNDGDKAAVLREITNYSAATAKKQFLAEEKIAYEMESWMKEAQGGKSVGLSEGNYIVAYQTIKGIEGLKDRSSGDTITNSKSLQVMEAVYKIPGLTDEQRKYLFECFDVGKTVIHWNKALVQEKLKAMRKKAA